MPAMMIDEPSVVDTPVSNRFPVYTRANITDVWPGPATPLTFTSTSGRSNDVAWRRALARLGAFDLDEFEHDDGELLAIFHGYPYLNVSAQRAYGVRMPGATPELVDHAFFGTGATNVPAYRPDPRDDSPVHTEWLSRTIAEIMATTELPYFDKVRADLVQRRAARPDHACMSERELVRYVAGHIGEVFAVELEEHMYLISASSIPLGLIQGVAAALGDPGLAIRALSGQGGIDSAAPSIRLWDLSRVVAGSPTLTKVFDAGVDEVLPRVAELAGADGAAFLQEFQAFLDEFGSRCANEYDLASVSWETNPIVPLTAIERMRLQPDANSPRRALDRLAQDRAAATAAMREMLGDDEATAGQLDAALRVAGVLLRARETSKGNLILIVNEGRVALHELGRRMLQQGHFEQATDFTLLRLQELDEFAADPGAWQDELASRRAYYAEIARREPPFVTDGRPGPPSTWPRRTQQHAEPASAGEAIQGIGSCPGTASGRARVVRNPEDAGDLEPGEILVCPQTDPAWTPLFLAAAAVVVDVGAPLSHASIVSRELGIPCVVSAREASRRIRSGALLSVDGTTGVVTVIEA